MIRLLLLSLVIGSGAATAQDSPKPKRILIELTEAEVAAVKKKVALSLVDPDSAKFSGIAATADADVRSVKTVCGFFNAKNGFGGYVGFKPFSMLLVTQGGKADAIALFAGVDARSTKIVGDQCQRDAVPLVRD